jgi:predicted NUDIX family NTP pyrophosphohydrolase
MRKSAGILVFRKLKNEVEFFLVHPGGPFWQKKEIGAWSIPKGEYIDEDPLTAAKREFEEETGQTIDGAFFQLTPVKLKSGKLVQAWAVRGDTDASNIRSNEFDLEWPPRSGKKIRVAEVDKAGWFNADRAKELLNPAQAIWIDELNEKIINGDIS